MNPAQKCREEKARYPHRYCPACLWKIRTPRGFNPCRNHPHLMPKQPDPNCVCLGTGRVVDDVSPWGSCEEGPCPCTDPTPRQETV